jgi:transcriptional regulator of nitric oxide reductase
MIEHIAFFRFKKEVDQEGLNEIARQFRAFKGIIPGLVEISSGINVTEDQVYGKDYNLGLRMLFASQADFDAYVVNPLHTEISIKVSAVMETAAVCDFISE